MSRIIGKRIMLREFQEEDLIPMRRWLLNGEITRNLSDTFLTPHCLNQTRNYLNDILDGKSPGKDFVIARVDTEEYIGQCNLFNIDMKNRAAEIGIVIGDPDLLGKGYGTDALKLLMNFGFNRLNLHRLELRLHEYNGSAYQCYSKLGFTEEGRKREDFFIDGKYMDTIIMGILEEEYNKLYG